MHPSCELRPSGALGLGVFATEGIPRGTLVYVKDDLEVEVDPVGYEALAPVLRPVVDKYSYVDPQGVRVISWDIAKYVNHRCDCNSMSTGWGFEIAVRDIERGEEVTDEYGLFNLDYTMELACGCDECRLVLQPDDFDRYHEIWDATVRSAMADVPRRAQPLWGLLDPDCRREVERFLAGKGPYRSVSELRRTAVSG